MRKLFSVLATGLIGLFASSKPQDVYTYERDPAPNFNYSYFGGGSGMSGRKKHQSPTAAKKRKQKNAAERRARKRMYAAR